MTFKSSVCWVLPDLPMFPSAVLVLLCVAPPIFRLCLAWALWVSSESCCRLMQSCARRFAALGCALETASNHWAVSDFSCCCDRTPTRNNSGNKGLFWLHLSWKGRYGSCGVRLLLYPVRKKTDECSALLVFCVFEAGPLAHGMVLHTSRVGLPSSI